MRASIIFRLFLPGIIGLFITSCNKPKAVVEEEWTATQPKLVGYYIEEDGNKVKVAEEKFYVDGKTQCKGEFDNEGNRQGEWRYYYEDGKLWSLGKYEHGLKTGRKEVYWPDGKMRYEGYFTNDQKSGHWIFYKEDGTVLDERDFGEPAEE